MAEAGGKEKTRYEIVQEALKREEKERRGKQGLDHEEGNEGSRPWIQGQLSKAWMGGETPGWKERRLAEEQERIAKGEGYGSMIMDQIWEVWNWGREKGEELEEKDREILRERRRREEFPEIGKGKDGR